MSCGEWVQDGASCGGVREATIESEGDMAERKDNDLKSIDRRLKMGMWVDTPVRMFPPVCNILQLAAAAQATVAPFQLRMLPWRPRARAHRR